MPVISSITQQKQNKGDARLLRLRSAQAPAGMTIKIKPAFAGMTLKT